MTEAAKVLASLKKKRLVVLCVGNVLRQDDGAGPFVAGLLKKAANSLVIDGGQTPENSVSKITGFKPETLLLVDAADFGGKPGEITLISEAEIDGSAVSTHGLPLSMLTRYLKREIAGLEVVIAGIQPEKRDFGEDMCPAVKTSAEKLADTINEILGG